MFLIAAHGFITDPPRRFPSREIWCIGQHDIRLECHDTRAEGVAARRSWRDTISAQGPVVCGGYSCVHRQGEEFMLRAISVALLRSSAAP